MRVENNAEATKGKNGNHIYSEDQCRSQGTAAEHRHLVCPNERKEVRAERYS